MPLVNKAAATLHRIQGFPTPTYFVVFSIFSIKTDNSYWEKSSKIWQAQFVYVYLIRHATSDPNFGGLFKLRVEGIA